MIARALKNVVDGNGVASQPLDQLCEREMVIIISIIRATDDEFPARLVTTTTVHLLSRQRSVQRCRWARVDVRHQGLEDMCASAGFGTYRDGGKTTDNSQALLYYEVGRR